MATFPATYKPDMSSQYVPEIRALDVGFGDGYSMSGPDGLNTIVDTWNLKFSNRPSADIAAIKSFLDTHGTWTVFDWIAPDDVSSKKWRVKGSYQISDAEAGNRSISFSVRRYFGP